MEERYLTKSVSTPQSIQAFFFYNILKNKTTVLFQFILIYFWWPIQVLFGLTLISTRMLCVVSIDRTHLLIRGKCVYGRHRWKLDEIALGNRPWIQLELAKKRNFNQYIGSFSLKRLLQASQKGVQLWKPASGDLSSKHQLKVQIKMCASRCSLQHYL
jgi:hypothetical protein